jgi:S1-C subfamily serine protease
MKTFYDLIVYIQRNKIPGAKITLGIIRDGSPKDIVVTLGTRPQP